MINQALWIIKVGRTLLALRNDQQMGRNIIQYSLSQDLDLSEQDTNFRFSSQPHGISCYAKINAMRARAQRREECAVIDISHGRDIITSRM